MENQIQNQDQSQNQSFGIDDLINNLFNYEIKDENNNVIVVDTNKSVSIEISFDLISILDEYFTELIKRYHEKTQKNANDIFAEISELITLWSKKENISDKDRDLIRMSYIIVFKETWRNLMIEKGYYYTITKDEYANVVKDLLNNKKIS